MNWKPVICHIARGGVLFVGRAGFCLGHICVMDQAGSCGNASEIFCEMHPLLLSASCSVRPDKSLDNRCIQ